MSKEKSKKSVVLTSTTGDQYTYSIVGGDCNLGLEYKRLDAPVLIETPSETIQVSISHLDLGNLIGKLMQMCDLMGDTEQRNAAKRTIKLESRRWLNDIYEQAGYKNIDLPEELK